MFIFKKIVTAFLIPPGMFIVLLLFFGVWLVFKKDWKAAIINFLMAGLIWFISISPVSDVMLRGLESRYKIPKDPHGDVIILLGGGVYDEAVDMSGIGTPAEDMLGRIVAAVRLQKKLNIPVIVSGGSVFDGKKAEAPIIRRFLIDLGVPSDKVIIEVSSRDTIENAKYTGEICKRLGYKKPLLVTSAYHMRRAVLSFEKTNISVIPFPADFKTWDKRQYGWEDYLPGEPGKTVKAMREHIGFIFYKFAY